MVEPMVMIKMMKRLSGDNKTALQELLKQESMSTADYLLAAELLRAAGEIDRWLME